jgi:hypothetical protein
MVVGMKSKAGMKSKPNALPFGMLDTNPFF